MKQLSPPSEVQYRLVVTAGAEQGKVYRLRSVPVVIGRGADCDIALTHDQKCSRKHAQITLGKSGFEVHDISEHNKIWVNGIETKAAVMPDHTYLQVGDTQFEFIIETANQALSRQSAARAPQAGAARRKKPPALNPVRVILIGVVLLTLVLVLSPSSQRAAESKIRGEEQVQADIDAAKALEKAAVSKRPGGEGADRVPVDEAQAAYIRGFRDYRKGQYGRALESFQACLTILPTHALCNRYLRLSQRKNNELIQYNMVLGRRYRDQEQYSPCAAAFRNVMNMVQDQNNATFKEAQASFLACNAFVEERY